MAVEVHIAAPFRRLAGNRASVESQGKDVAELLENLESQFPGFRSLMFDERGQIPRHISIYVNSQEIASLRGLTTALKDGDQVAIIPAIAGGSQGGHDSLLTPEQRQRYSRHLVLPHWGEEGQRRLMEGRVLVVGTGGLGSPALLYLAGAGVGTLGIVEFDVVDISNLPRQVLHQMDDLGRAKAVSARESIGENNPEVKVVSHETRLTSENALEIIAEYDMVVAAVDNLPTRYLINDACVFLDKPMIEASILAYEGQCTVFLPGKGCYRCLYPAPPPAGVMPSPAEAGVLSIVPAVMGPIQAVEAIKLILGIGESLNGRLLLFDAMGMEFREVRVRRDPSCAVCGDKPTVTQLIDYDEFCSAASGR